MADHVFLSTVPAMISGFSDPVASVPSQKFAVRTRQRFLGGQMLTVHPAGEGKGASSEMNVILLPYMLGTLCCQLSLWLTFGQDGCCSKQPLLWWSALAVRAPCQEDFWYLSKLKGARRCNSDISSAFPSSIPWYARLTRVNFLSICVNNYCSSYSYNYCHPANAPAKKCLSLLTGFFCLWVLILKQCWFENFSFRNRLLISRWLLPMSLTGPSSQRSPDFWILPSGKPTGGVAKS